MKLTDPRRLAITILNRVFNSDSYADILLSKSFQRISLSPEDRALTTELVYGTLRWLEWLRWILKKTYHGEWLRIPVIVQRILEIGLYQILFLDRIPDHAAVDEAVRIAVENKGLVWGRVVNGMLREILRNPEFQTAPSMEKDPVLAISARWSHPEWLVQKWVNLWGVERTLSLCKANNKRPRMGIRINPHRTSREGVLDELRNWNVGAKPSKLLDEFITVEKGSEIISSEYLKNGLFSIQDVSAGLVGRLMNPEFGERIIDLTAAPGGKSTHMGELGNDSSVIIAVDRHPNRIRMVLENQNRLGLKNIFPVLADGRKMGVRSVDKVLVDAPCSALGVLRKRGELRWRRKPEDIPKRVSLQEELLEASACMIRAGGVLVYSTCTVLPEENEEVVDTFLGRHSNFVVEDARQFVDSSVVSERGFIETWPDRHGTDGSFAARLKRVR